MQEELLNEVCRTRNIYTTESLAWKLLMDDSEIQTCLQTLVDSQYPDSDPCTFTFEILLTVFLEMIVNTLKIEAMNNNEKFVFKCDAANLDNILPMLKKKFLSIQYYLFVHPTDINDNNNLHINLLTKSSYCRVIFRNNENDTRYFKVYGSNVDINKPYHMILNRSYEKTTNISNVYAVCFIKDKMYKILFNRM